MLSPTDRSKGSFKPSGLMGPHPVTPQGQRKYKRGRAARLEDPIRITRSQSGSVESSPLKDSPIKDAFDLDEPIALSPRRAFKRTKTVRPSTPKGIQRIPRVGTLSPDVINNSNYFIEAPTVTIPTVPSTPPKREPKADSPIKSESMVFISGEESQAWSLFEDLEVRKTPKRFQQKPVEIVEEESSFVRSIHESLVELHDSPSKKIASKSPSPPPSPSENASKKRKTYASARTFLMDECEEENEEEDHESDSGPVQNLHDLRHSGSVNRFSDTLHYFFEPFEDLSSNTSTRLLALIELNDKVLKDEVFAKEFENCGIPAAVVSSALGQTEEGSLSSSIFLIMLSCLVLHGGNEVAQKELVKVLVDQGGKVRKLISKFLPIDETIKELLDALSHKKMVGMAMADLFKTMKDVPAIRTITLNFLVGVCRCTPDRSLFDVADVLSVLHTDIERLPQKTHFYIQMELFVLEDLVDGGPQFQQLNLDIKHLICGLPEKNNPNRRNHVLCCIPGMRIALTMLNKGSKAMLNYANPLLAIVQNSGILCEDELPHEEHDLALYSLGLLVALADESEFRQSLSSQSVATILEMVETIDSKREGNADGVGYFCLFVGVLRLDLTDQQKSVVCASLKAFLVSVPDTGSLKSQITEMIDYLAV